MEGEGVGDLYGQGEKFGQVCTEVVVSYDLSLRSSLQILCMHVVL